MLHEYFDETVFEKDMYDVGLPTFLKSDIEQLLAGIKDKSGLLDCMMDEVLGSINSAECDNLISAEHASHLRQKYCLVKKF